MYTISEVTLSGGIKAVKIEKDSVVIDIMPELGLYKAEIKSGHLIIYSTVFAENRHDIRLDNLTSPSGTNDAILSAINGWFFFKPVITVVFGSPQHVIVDSSALPTGAATSANQTSEIALLTNIDAGIPTSLGQTTMANSMPVTIASDQSAISITGVISPTTNYGNDRVADNGSQVQFNTIGTKYAVLGLALNTAVSINLMQLYANSTPSDSFVLQFILNPTVAGTFTYSAIANSNCEQAIGALANTVTGGTILHSVLIYASNKSVELFSVQTLNKITQTGTDKVVICMIPINANSKIRAILNFKEQ